MALTWILYQDGVYSIPRPSGVLDGLHMAFTHCLYLWECLTSQYNLRVKRFLDPKFHKDVRQGFGSQPYYRALADLQVKLEVMKRWTIVLNACTPMACTHCLYLEECFDIQIYSQNQKFPSPNLTNVFGRAFLPNLNTRLLQTFRWN